MTPNWSNQTIWTGDNLPVMRGLQPIKKQIFTGFPHNSTYTSVSNFQFGQA